MSVQGTPNMEHVEDIEYVTDSSSTSPSVYESVCIPPRYHTESVPVRVSSSPRLSPPIDDVEPVDRYTNLSDDVESVTVSPHLSPVIDGMEPSTPFSGRPSSYDSDMDAHRNRLPSNTNTQPTLLSRQRVPLRPIAQPFPAEFRAISSQSEAKESFRASVLDFLECFEVRVIEKEANGEIDAEIVLEGNDGRLSSSHWIFALTTLAMTLLDQVPPPFCDTALWSRACEMVNPGSTSGFPSVLTMLRVRAQRMDPVLQIFSELLEKARADYASHRLRISILLERIDSKADELTEVNRDALEEYNSLETLGKELDEWKESLASGPFFTPICNFFNWERDLAWVANACNEYKQRKLAALMTRLNKGSLESLYFALKHLEAVDVRPNGEMEWCLREYQNIELRNFEAETEG